MKSCIKTYILQFLCKKGNGWAIVNAYSPNQAEEVFKKQTKYEGVRVTNLHETKYYGEEMQLVFEGSVTTIPSSFYDFSISDTLKKYIKEIIELYIASHPELVKVSELNILKSELSFASQVIDADTSYFITEDFYVEQGFKMPDNCNLYFFGGKLSGYLQGSNTNIVAPLSQIFDANIELSGSFLNECAYPEWWGAKPSDFHGKINYDRDSATLKKCNCRQAIQAAFDSPFYEIHLTGGLYYVGNPITRDGITETALLYLTYAKTIKLAGDGGYYKSMGYHGGNSVIWTDEDVNVLAIYIKNGSVGIDMGAMSGTVIEGGFISITHCPEFSHAAILLLPRSRADIRLETSLLGPIGGVYSSSDWNTSTLHIPTSEELDAGYKGYGIRIFPSHNPAYEHSGAFFLGKIDCKVYGFGHGFCCSGFKYGDDAKVTGLELGGYIDNCFRYIFAPTAAFSGGKITSIIQARNFNAKAYCAEPILQGNFDDCYVDPFIWDLLDVDIIRLTSGINVQFGSRILGLMSKFEKAGGTQKNLPSDRVWTDTEPEHNSNDWEKGINGCVSIIDSGAGATRGYYGNYDKNALSSQTAYFSLLDYIHTLDNDLLSIDSMEPGYNINVSYSSIFQPLTGKESIWDGDSSPFDKNGMVFKWKNIASGNYSDASITVTISFPTDYKSKYKVLQFLAAHFKGSLYNHFKNLRLELEYNIPSSSTVYHKLLYNGSYTEVSRQSGAGFLDIILPFFFMYNGNPNSSASARQCVHYPRTLTFYFSNYQSKGGNLWGEESFKFSIEGCLNRRFNNQLFTSNGGSLGKSITRLGKPYILGTDKCTNFSDLPANACVGARGIITEVYSEGGSTVERDYAVVKTSNGWIIENLIASADTLQALPERIGSITEGQQAFNTDTGFPVWMKNGRWISIV